MIAFVGPERDILLTEGALPGKKTLVRRFLSPHTPLSSAELVAETVILLSGRNPERSFCRAA